MKKLKGLVITFCFPPHESPESFVTYKLLNSLSDYCDLTILRPEYRSRRNKVVLKKSIKEVKVKIPKFIGKLISLKRLPLRPDRFILYYFVFKKMLKKMCIKNFDFIMTRSQFHSSHLLGLYLKNTHNLPWMAHFSDPWMDNPVQKKIPIMELLSNIIQKKVLYKTDFNSFPISKLRDNFNKQTKKDLSKNSIIIPHSIESYKLPVNKKRKRIYIRFFGKIYAGRKIKNTLKALTNLVESEDNLVAEFYVDEDFFKNYSYFIQRFKSIKFIRYLDYNKYRERLKSSSILILIDIDEKYGNLFFQSKLVDYLQSLRPILHIGSAPTFNKRIILKNNGESCINNSIDIYKALLRMIKNLEDFKPNYDLIDLFLSKNIAKKLDNFIRRQVNHG